MEPFTGIYFDGHFYADVAEGGMTLLSEISFTATLNYVISDQSKLNTMFGGQLPVDILKREASLTVERAFTKLFEGGC
jgi:ribose 5-phosphate isomerase